MSTPRKSKFGSEGVAIYFPKTQVDLDNDADGSAYQPGNTVYPVEFVDKQKWANFLHHYLTKVG